MTDASVGGPARRRWPWILLAVVVVLGVAVVATVAVQRRELAQAVLASQLRALGLTDLRYEVVDFGFGGMRVHDVHVGAEDDLTAAEIEAHYTLAGLRAGVIESLTLRGLALRGRWDEAGVSFGSLDPLFAPSESPDPAPAQPIALPMREIAIEDFSLYLETPDGPIDVTGSVGARAGADRTIALEFSAAGTHPQLGQDLPVEARGSAELRGSELRFDVTARNAGGELVAVFEGRHDLESGVGTAAVDTEPLEFAAHGLQPAAIYPALAEWFEQATGTLEARGTLDWGAEGGSRSRIDVGFSDFSVSSEDGSIKNLNAAIRLDGPWPLSTPPRQLVSMAQIDFGLQLQNGLIDFQLRPEGVLDVASAEWSLAGGTVRTRGRIDPAATKQSLVLDLDGLDLAELLALVDLAGLSGEGRLGGRIPLVRRGSTLEIRGGLISATPAGGWIRYQPIAGISGGGEGQGFDVVLSALRNFRYQELRATLDGDTEGPVNLAIHLSGSNPDYLSGHPVEFNLNVEAHLVDLLRNATAVYRIPKQIEERLGEISGDHR